MTTTDELTAAATHTYTGRPALEAAARRLRSPLAEVATRYLALDEAAARLAELIADDPRLVAALTRACVARNPGTP